MIVLGIESSCDETAVAVVKNGNELLSNVIFSSMDLHKIYGGIVPEIAARSHIESIIPVLERALWQAFPNQKSKVKKATTTKFRHKTFDPWDLIDAIAVTYGPGLGGSLLVGVMTARTLAITKNKPLYAINHVEGHVYASFLTKTTLKEYKLPKKYPEFPMVSLIVSGGHSQLVLFKNHFKYKLLGQTRDDALGEAFDKVAKIIGLPYPGGPSISKFAELGDADKYQFPKAKLDQKFEFSFSGIKTAVLRVAQQEVGGDFTLPSFKIAKRLSEKQKVDIAASFQKMAIETVVDKTVLAYSEFHPKSVVIAGGVASNQELRHQLSDRLPISIQYIDPKLCTDNGAMIATLGCYKAMNNQPTSNPLTLQIETNLSM
jgi:N6-L-threonylcarbamoyladenine synthase